MQFRYEALTTTGTPIKWVIEAASAAQAEEALWNADLVVVKLRRHRRLFPPLIAEMVRVGEETGTLEANLTTVADIYEAETEQATMHLVAMIEPPLIFPAAFPVAVYAVPIGLALKKA